MSEGWPRRQVLRALAAVVPSALARRPAAAAEPVRLLAAGSPGGRLAGWATPIAAALQAGWPGGGAVEVELAGGDDGVTGANRFEAAGPSDATALLLPGAALSAWLAGNPRVQFDVARWVPLLCGLSGGLLAGRRGLTDARPQNPLRLAIADPLGPGAACLLGLDLLHVAARPVMQPAEDAAAAAAALRSGGADAAFMAGSLAVADAEAAGAMPLLTLGTPDDQDPVAAIAPALRALLGVGVPHSPGLLNGWTAAAAAVQVEFALVLSALSDAAEVAVWREAAAAAAADPALLAATGAEMRCVAGSAATDTLAAVATCSAGLVGYRRWLAARFGYQAG